MSAMRRGALAALGLVSMLAGGGALIAPAAAQQKTLKFVPEADLRSLDPTGPRPTPRETAATWCTTPCLR
jgi:hypothetical protein